MVEVREVGQVLGLGLVATAPVAAGATVLDEEPLWTVSIEKIFNDHAFLQRKDVQARPPRPATRRPSGRTR